MSWKYDTGCWHGVGERNGVARGALRRQRVPEHDPLGEDNGRYDGGGSRWTYQQAAVMVQQAYRRVFRREPDRDAQPWVEEVLKNGWSQRQLEQALLNTPEGRGR